MRDRLIEIIRDMECHPEKTCPNLYDDDACKKCIYDEGNVCDVFARKADYLIKNNVMVLPDIPFGTELYQIYGDKIYKLKLSSYMVRELDGQRILQWHLYDGKGFNGGGNVSEFGKTVFLTKEEAEQALKGGSE